MAAEDVKMKGVDEADWEAERQEMVDVVSRHFIDSENLTGVGRIGDRLRAAMLRVDRHRFVPESLVHLSYTDSALSIGHGQTISQPFIAALMIELAGVGPATRALEIGTGCGYVAALLSLVAREVYSIERVPELAADSSSCLGDQGFGEVHLRCGDGFEGWREAAPFDSILVSACAGELPEPLVEQLSVGGRMVIPVGAPNAYQELRVIEKTGKGDVEVRHGLPVAFVPLVHSAESVCANTSKSHLELDPP
jgi:protein-L-isoaspartate(D-aspartate) O-methyltransferase